MRPINGLVVRMRCQEYALIYIGDNLWGMLAICAHRDHTLTAPIFHHDEYGKWLFTSSEITVKCADAIVLPQRIDFVLKEAQ